MSLEKRYFEGRGKKFQEVLLEFGELLGSVRMGDYIPWFDWLGKFNGFYEKCTQNLDEFVEVIEEHIKHGSDVDVGLIEDEHGDFCGCFAFNNSKDKCYWLQY